MDEPLIQIRAANSADAETIAAFNAAMARETEQRELDDRALLSGVRHVLEQPELGVYYLAQLDGRVVGQMLITREWSDWRNGLFWWIQSVYVHPEARRRGVYRALHEWIERHGRTTPGVCGLRLYVETENAVAQRTYEQLGMARTSYALYETDWSSGRPNETPPAPRSLDIDLYCLSCGYNLRGLSGDPIRCPECGSLNPVGDVEIPAPIIAAQLRRMETWPATCFGAVLIMATIVGLWLFTLQLSGSSPADSLACVAWPGGLAAIVWIVGAWRFRVSCERKPGWLGALLRYHFFGALLVGGMLATGVLCAWLPFALFAARRSLATASMSISLATLILAGILAVLRPHWALWPYRRATACIEPLQREVAVTLAREHSRKRLFRRRRGLRMG